MNIAIIGTGNVGGALARRWAGKGHTIALGVRDMENFKGKELLSVPGIKAMPVQQAVSSSAVVLLATPAPAAIESARALGNTEGKIIIDAMNTVMGRGPAGFSNTTDAILANTATRDVVKFFKTTGANNLDNPQYGDAAIDMFMAGDSKEAKKVARQLALDAGFAECYDMGGNDRFQLMEQFAFVWINLAMFQGMGRNIAFKLMKR